MTTLFQEILSLLWIHVKDKNPDASSVDEETIRFFGELKSTAPITPRTFAPRKEVLERAPSQTAPKPLPPQKASTPAQTVKPPVRAEKIEPPPESTKEETIPQLIHKHDKLLPKTFSFLPVDTFQTRKTIRSLPSASRLRDLCLYEGPEQQCASWAFFSFPLPPQEDAFLQSVCQAVSEKLQKKAAHFSCLDTSFQENLTLSAHDSEKLFFFIEPHNESTLKRLLEAIPEFSRTLPKEVNPFLPLGSIHGNPLHLFLLTPSTSQSTEVKSRLWLALKQLAFGTQTP